MLAGCSSPSTGVVTGVVQTESQAHSMGGTGWTAVWSTGRVRLTNDCYLITLGFRSGVERYFKDHDQWAKVTTRGHRMPATAEQVLNHLLPALAGVKPGITVQVEHRDLSELAAQLLDGLRD